MSDENQIDDMSDVEKNTDK